MTNKFSIEDKKTLETTGLNGETKKVSLNASLTNSFSVNSIDMVLFGNPTNNIKSLYEEDVEALLEELSIKVPVREYLGPKAINNSLWNQYVEGTISSPIILNFLKKKKHVRAYSFLNLMEVMKDLNLLVEQKYETKKIIREHLHDLGIYKELIQNSNRPNYVRKVLHEFDTVFINPFQATKDCVVWMKEDKLVIKFNHPDCEKYFKYLLRERITEITESSYHYKLKRFFLWLTTVIEEFKEYSINNIPIYKIRNHHLVDYKRHLLIIVKNGERKISRVSDDLYIIKDFFEYLYRNKKILHDVTKNIGVIKQKKYQYRDLPSKDEIRQFFEIIEIYAKDPLRESLGFGLLFNNGIRIDELAQVSA